MEAAGQHSDSAILQSDDETSKIPDADTPIEPQDVVQELKQSGDSIATPIESTDSPLPDAGPAPDTSVVSKEPPTNQGAESNPKPVTKSNPPKESAERRKEDEKLAMYKALAIKLKKELVKSREELTRLQESSQAESSTLKNKVDSLEGTLNTERQTYETTTTTLEAKVRILQQQLSSTDTELQSLQNEFESYKVMASKIMQQNASTQLSSGKTFEDDRYKQIKELSDDQKKQISRLKSQLELSFRKNEELVKKSQQLQDDLDKLRERLKDMETIAERYEILSKENDNLKSALVQFRSKLRCSSRDKTSKLVYDADKPPICDHSCNAPMDDNRDKARPAYTITRGNLSGGVSPSASMKDESQTNSSSSHDGSTSGYVHVKPANFEIISRSSVTDDAQNQIDSLTKAYLDSETTNSLLTEQVKSLKEEIGRLQTGSDQLVIAKNLEYLKNVLFKYLSLDSSQVEQKQRLIPVLSTVLKLNPEETAKLNSLVAAERPSLASSFFKL